MTRRTHFPLSVAIAPAMVDEAPPRRSRAIGKRTRPGFAWTSLSPGGPARRGTPAIRPP